MTIMKSLAGSPNAIIAFYPGKPFDLIMYTISLCNVISTYVSSRQSTKKGDVDYIMELT